MPNTPTKPPHPSRLPEYEKAYAVVLMESFNGLAQANDPVLNMISRTSMDELPSGEVPQGTTFGASGPPLEFEMTFRIANDAVRFTDVNEWAASVQASVDEALPSHMAKIFGRINEITENAGQVIDAGGRPFSGALFLELLEKIQIDFDDNGKPRMPTLIVSPEMAERLAQNPPTPDEMRQFDALIEKKRKEFYARRRVRKLD